MKFSEYNLQAAMIEGLNKLKIVSPTKIQQLVIPKALKNKNIIGISNTGSGKTYAFLIPLLEKINSNENKLQAVIISPTRELAQQIYNVCIELVNVYNTDIIVKKFVGGTDRIDVNTNCHIAIGTPGRISDLFLQPNSLRIDQISTLVIDEADMVFEDNYLEKIDLMKAKFATDVQYLVFSATINANLASFIKQYLNDTQIIDISDNKGVNSNVDHILLKAKYDRKDELLLKLLKVINPYTCLIFASNKKTVEQIYYLINQQGYKAIMLHGDLEPRKRKRVIKDILNSKYQYIVASDIASRGLDIEMVTHVISYDLPNELVFYSHRSGRAGRYDNHGTSFVLYDESDVGKIVMIKNFGIDFKEYIIFKNELREKSVYKRKHKDDQVKIILKAKDYKVKPNAKKKRQAKITKMKNAQNKKRRPKK